MRREWLGLLIAGLMMLPDVAVGQESQCRKRILVYLDVSGSMRGPYQKTLAGLDGLFRQRGFIEENDEVTVVLFGEDERMASSVEGPAAAMGLIERLKGYKDWRAKTDFRAVFSHLAQTLPEGVFNRQVVLLASDFAHEPVNNMKAEPAIADWRVALSESQDTLGDLFVPGKRTVMLLYQADASSANRQETARQVTADLKASFPVVGVVDSDASDPASLTFALRKSLLDPPRLQISRDPADASKLRFTVSNPNCYPLNLTRLSARPEAGGETELFAVNPDERELVKKGTRTIKRPAPVGDEWVSAGLRATVETEEGVTGESSGTSGNWLKYRATSAVFERRPVLSDILRLDLELTGYTDPASVQAYNLTFGDDADPLALGKYEAPAFSDLTPRSYRIVLPLRADAEPGSDIRVGIPGAETLSEGADRVSLLEDASATHTNRILASVVAIAFVGLLIGFTWVNRTLAPYPVFRLTRRDHFYWIAMVIIWTFLLFGFILRITLLRWGSPEGTDWWLGVLTVLAVLVLAAFLALEFLRARFARSVITGTPLPLNKYLRHSRINIWAPLVVGFVLAALTFSLWWPLRSPEARESRRSETPTPLHVTSD